MKKVASCILLLVSFLLLLLSFAACGNSKIGNDDLSIGGIPIIYNTVTYQTNGGNKLSPQKVSEQLDVAPTPKRSGYQFDGWYLDENLTAAASFPLSVSTDMTLYAKWLKLTDVRTCTDASIKLWANDDPGVYWDISPMGFDLQKLSTQDYYMTITVTYTVSYQKDYDVWLDIGYAGAPKYQAGIYDEDRLGKYESDLSTTKGGTTRTMTFTRSTASLIGEDITLSFTTNNIQNTIFFEDITVTYECLK